MIKDDITDIYFGSFKESINVNFHIHCTNFCPNCGMKLEPDLLDKEAEEEMMVIYNCKCGLRFDVDMNNHNHETITIINLK